MISVMQVGYLTRLIITATSLSMSSSFGAFAEGTAPDNSKPLSRPARTSGGSATVGGPQSDPPLRVQRAQAAPVNADNTASTALNKSASTAANKSASTNIPSASTKAPVSAKASVPAKPPVSTKPPAATKPMERGVYLSRHGAYADAMNFFTKASDADPKNPEAYNRRARTEWQLEKNTEALEDARYAISLNPDYAEAFCTRAAILNSTGKYHDAIVDAALAMELKPKLREAYTIQASAYRNLKQYREADDILQKLGKVTDPVSAFDEWAPTIDYTAYISGLQSKVRQHFQPPQGMYPPIVVLFKLHRTGEITDVRVNNAGVATADNAAIEATKTAAPFDQPPAGSPPDFDVFVVLDPPMEQQASVSMDATAAAGSAAAPAQAPVQSAPKAGINWGPKLNQGLNTGLNLMRFVKF
jgi:TonB family protein